MARVDEIERILSNWDRELEQARNMRYAGHMSDGEVQEIARGCRAAHAHAKLILEEIDKLTTQFYEQRNI
jgi:hypothetical protein